MKPFARFAIRSALFAVLVSAPAALAQAAAKPAPGATKPAAPKAQAAPAPKPTLLFFINPAGRPCQMQDQILSESKAQWEPLATLRYARTDTAADRETFYAYGVRSLPNLILVGTDGKELRRFPPGIQSAESILAGIRAGSSR
jgi:hypothetical protein